MTLRVVSLFSGCGGFDLGLERAGFTTVAQCEWDAVAHSVLERHWPDTQKWFDVADVRGTDLPDADIVAFGSPCQDLSVAGNRKGLEGDRSNLFFEAIRIIKEYQADGSRSDDARLRYILWENVPGSLSSNRGFDFAAVLDALAELRDVVTVEWRILDAQHFGNPERPVPQRRRRVFVLARLCSPERGSEQVLPFGTRLRGNLGESGQTGEDAASTVADGVGDGRWESDPELNGFLPRYVQTVRPTFNSKNATNLNEAMQGALLPVEVMAFDRNNVTSPENRSQPDWGRPCHPVVPFGDPPHVVVAEPVPIQEPGARTGVSTTDSSHGIGIGEPGDPMFTLQAKHTHGVAVGDSRSLAVRRLTPLECERLQGYDDDWTRWAADGTEIADTHRYRMAGNGVCSPVATWLANCILAFEAAS